jgi:uncharacterized protein YndB with AHSA1/START domain
MPSPLAETRRAEAVVTLPPIDIWHAFTRPEQLQYWAADTADIDLRVGGAFNLSDPVGLELRATIERLVEGRRLVLRPLGRGDDAHIEVDLVKLAGGETRVTINHPDPEHSEPWRAALENLKSVWERGVDLREANKGILGVGVGDIAQGDRPVPGVPDGTGARLTAILSGGPAEAGGLEKNDVVVSFASHAIRGERDLVRRIQGTRPDTPVTIEAVRGGKTRSFSVTIGKRTARTEPPPPREDLLARIREASSRANVKLRKAVEGLSEESATKPEGPNKWSVAQVLAHLSVTERVFQCWLDEAIRGGRPAIDDGAVTNAWKLGAVLASHPSVADLLERLRRDQAETMALIERVPDDVVHFRPRWARVARIALEFNTHSDDHLDQIARIRKTIGA